MRDPLAASRRRINRKEKNLDGTVERRVRGLLRIMSSCAPRTLCQNIDGLIAAIEHSDVSSHIAALDSEPTALLLRIRDTTPSNIVCCPSRAGEQQQRLQCLPNERGHARSTIGHTVKRNKESSTVTGNNGLQIHNASVARIKTMKDRGYTHIRPSTRTISPSA